MNSARAASGIALGLGVALALAGFLALPARADDTPVVESRLAEGIVAFIAANPQADLAAVAGHANAQLSTQGLPYEFDDFAEEEGPLRLAGEGRSFVAEHDEDGGMCGERFVVLPTLGTAAGWLDLAQEQRAWRVLRPETLRLDAMTVLTADQSAVTATIEVPWQSEPFGATKDGLGVVLRRYLADTPAVQAWWEGLRRGDPAIASERAFLPLIVTEGSVRFGDDPALLREPAIVSTENVETSENAYLRQRTFADPAFVVEYSEPCS